MSSLVPQGAGIRKAVQWVSKMREEEKTPLPKLLEEAGARFNLSPKDTEFLHRFFTGGEKSKEEKK